MPHQDLAERTIRIWQNEPSGTFCPAQEQHAMNILLIDDHALFRAGLAMLLQDLAPTSTVCEYGRVADALADICSGKPADIVFLDLHMPDQHGLHALRVIKDQRPKLPVIIMSSDNRAETVATAIDEGASSFVPKSASPEFLELALRATLKGKLFIPDGIMSGGSFPEAIPLPTKGMPTLTEREKEVLDCLLRGMSNKMISRTLGIAEPTARQHTKAIFDALQVNSRAQAIVESMRRGIRLQND
jgi:two-component system, NarL family, nitrate/nitrite response regulator NarL